MDLKQSIRDRLNRCREKTLWLLEAVPDEFLRKRVHSFYSPIGWHFGHVGRTEEFWVLGEALKRPLLDDRLTFIFADLPNNPKDDRVNIPDRDGIIEYLRRTRERVLAALAEGDLDTAIPYLCQGYAWEFALQHECQHQETIAEMLQLIRREMGGSSGAVSGAVCGVDWRSDHRAEMVSLPGGRLCMGSDRHDHYDNEKEPHDVFVAPFRLASTPVTAFEWTQFMEDGGYSRSELWSDEGWVWRRSENAVAPEYWVRDEGVWRAYGPHGLRPIHPDEPASCLSWHEAEAFARWSGKRLPSEQEWEWARREGERSPGAPGAPPPVQTGQTFGASGEPLPTQAGQAFVAPGEPLPIQAGQAFRASGEPLPIQAGQAFGASGVPLPIQAGQAFGASGEPLPIQAGQAFGAPGEPLPIQAGQAFGASGEPLPIQAGRAFGARAEPPLVQTGQTFGASGEPLPSQAGQAFRAHPPCPPASSGQGGEGFDDPRGVRGTNAGLVAWCPRPVTEGVPDRLGLCDMAGNVWEWTSSLFAPYPGFVAFPYDGYSKDHMDGRHRVCRGGSWATAQPILRPSFRNWYVPSYRQGFLGVRLAE